MQIIYLNGPSSVGKTTLSKALQEALDEPFLHMSFDKVIGWMPQKLNNWTGGKAPLGFCWEPSWDVNGFVIQKLQLGSFAQEMQRSFREVVHSLAKSGHHLIIDDFAFGQENMDAWKDKLKEFPTLWVGLKAPLEILEKREKREKKGFQVL